MLMQGRIKLDGEPNILYTNYIKYDILSQTKEYIMAEKKKIEKKTTTVSIDKTIIKDFKGDKIGLSTFINIYGRKYLDGELS